MKDFAIDPAKRDTVVAGVTPVMTTDLRNNIYLSLAIERGSWFAVPTFGARWKSLSKKITAETPKRAVEICQAALKWIADSKRATKIDVTAEVNRELHRLHIHVTCWQGKTALTYDHFVEVG